MEEYPVGKNNNIGAEVSLHHWQKPRGSREGGRTAQRNCSTDSKDGVTKELTFFHFLHEQGNIISKQLDQKGLSAVQMSSGNTSIYFWDSQTYKI